MPEDSIEVPDIDPDSCCLEAEDDGLEMFDVDQTHRQHRLQVREQRFGLELVVVHGPKCTREGPSEVLALSQEQTARLAALAIRDGQICDAVEALASALRDGERDPEVLACIVLGTTIRCQPDMMFAAICACRDREARNRAAGKTE